MTGRPPEKKPTDPTTEKLRQEITQRRHIESVLQESEARYRAVVEDQTELICRFQPNGLLTFVNQAYCRYHEQTEDDLLGSHFRRVMIEADQERYRRHLAAFSLEEPVRHFECRVQLAGGELRWQRWTDRAIYDDQDNLIEFQAVGRDITERKQAEEALRQSRTEAKLFSGQLTRLLTVTADLSKAPSFNDLCRQAVVLGRERLGFDRLGIWFADKVDNVLLGAFGLDETGQLRDERERRHPFDRHPLQEEILIDRKPWTLLKDTPLYNDLGEVVGQGDLAMAALWDGHDVIGLLITDNLLHQQPITESYCRLLTLYAVVLGHLFSFKRVEEALRENEAFNQGVLDSLPAEVAVLDKAGTIVAVNEAWTRFSLENGCPDLQLTGVGANYLTVCTRAEGEDAALAQQALAGLQAILAGQGPEFSLEYPCHSPMEVRWFLLMAAPLSGRSEGAVVTHVNITARKRMENEKADLLEAVSRQREQLRALTGRLAEVQETERKQLAQELHDQVGRNLTALDLNLAIIRTQLPADQPGAAALQARLDDSLALVAATAQCIQDVMANLRPPVLDDYGMVAALRWYSEQFVARLGLTVTVRGQEPDPRLPAPLEHALFRIAQEALTNVIKHAAAKQVTVTLDCDDDRVRLSIADDGRGFDVVQRMKASDRQRWGLITMTERAEAVGGQCQITSQPGQGTQIVVVVSTKS